jgi:hypothetical protein
MNSDQRKNRRPTHFAVKIKNITQNEEEKFTFYRQKSEEQKELSQSKEKLKRMIAYSKNRNH